MAKGDPCKGKVHGARCPNVKPCPTHTARGEVRVNPLNPDANVVSLFTEEAQRRKGKKKTAAHLKVNKKMPAKKYRIGRKWTELVRAVRAGEYTWADVVNDMDSQELARCQFRDSAGNWSGRPPNLVPAEFVRACHNEMMERFNVAFRENLQRATDELMKLALESDMEDKDRARLLQYIIERVTGKVPEKIEVRQADPWEQIIDDIVSEVPTEFLERGKE